MILAAGRGERMRPLTDRTPKPLLEVGGEKLIERHLRRLAAAGHTRIVINLSWLGSQIRQAIGNGQRYGVEVRYSDEGPTALETAGGIFKALALLGREPFLVVNGDIWTDHPLLPAPLGADSHAHLVLVPNPPQHARGDFALEDGRVTEGSRDRYTYSGIGIYRREFFTGCTGGKFPLLPLLRRAIESGRLGGEVYGGRWYDIGTAERLGTLDSELRAAAGAPQ
ncbi:MAG TPA: nucleotidyltransferase family protein [Steroidobacteraceae bacterium]|nr:nucleotidyltransferase family protein [Steroidobacteraceae bacterium]